MSVNSPLARRMPGFDARHATRRARRTWMVAVVVVLAAAGAFLVLFLGRGPTHPAAAHHRSSPSHATPHILVTLASWQLSAPISRAVVVPGTAGAGQHLVILGGATTGGVTASGVFDLDVTNGSLTEVGYLRNTLAGAVGAVFDGQALVFGGTTASGTVSSSIQTISTAGPPSATAGTVVPESVLLGSLPGPRASAAAVTAGTTVYVVGGDDGRAPDASVLSTTDGRHLATVTSLPVPVAFPAVAAVGDKLYIFGGIAETGADAGRPVNSIQVVNLTTRTATVTRRHLPEPLAAASAVVLGQHVLLAGGSTTPAAGGTSGSTTVAGATHSSTPPAASVSTVWWFDPSSGSCTAVGHLPVAVSHAGVAVLGSTAWFVGGESDGTPVSAVQSLVVVAHPNRRAGSTP